MTQDSFKHSLIQSHNFFSARSEGQKCPSLAKDIMQTSGFLNPLGASQFLLLSH